ncbi:hypothetical protein AMATHDRAFT_46643 [Amanita thiersii Skay4041]|uniref:Transcription factor domain-containing protein n=1 Tax=Amanita thiersii Skay4041 TaxID=703135 RepID=A0A2A9NUT1_9AGAR|nr:hypothetical protein AMATHDRAFT_46643 [Amanita thiersii Skay4041]
MLVAGTNTGAITDQCHEGYLSTQLRPLLPEVNHDSCSTHRASNAGCEYGYASCATSDLDTATEAGQLMPMYSHLSSVYSSNMFEPLFNNLFSQQAAASTSTTGDCISWPNNPRSSSPEEFPFATQLQFQPTSLCTPNGSADAPMSCATPNVQSPYLDRSWSREPELQHYIHAPTFDPGNATPVLIDAMHACGALFVRTRKATQFILQTLASAREVLAQEFVRYSHTAVVEPLTPIRPRIQQIQQSKFTYYWLWYSSRRLGYSTNNPIREHPQASTMVCWSW